MEPKSRVKEFASLGGSDVENVDDLWVGVKGGRQVRLSREITTVIWFQHLK